MHLFRAFCLLALTTLVLGGCAGTPAFVRLADTQWQLTQLDGQAVDLEAARRDPYLLMHGDSQRLEGFGGCNRLNGSYSGGGQNLRFDSLASTRRYCANAMAQEEAFMHALERTSAARVDDGTLTLLDNSGHALAQFAAQPGR
jgi:heat shock protein HslJ